MVSVSYNLVSSLQSLILR